MSARTALVLSSDPYLHFLLERHPEGLEVTVGDSQMRSAAIEASGADVVVCEHNDPRRPELSAALGQRLVTVAAADDRSARGRGVIQRPLSAEEVLRAIDQADHRTPTAREDPLGALDRAYPGLIVLAGAFATGLFIIRDDQFGAVIPGIVVILYGLARISRRFAWLWLVDVAGAIGLAIAFDGTRGPFVMLGLVVAAGLGLRQRPIVALPLSLGIGVANVVGASIARPDVPFDATVAVQSLLVVALVTTLANLGASYVRSFEDRDAERLGEVLQELRELARSQPDALELVAVARRGLDALCGAAGAHRGVLLLTDADGDLEVAATRNVPIPPGTRVAPTGNAFGSADVAIVDGRELPERLAAVTDDSEQCTVARLRWRGGGRGFAVVGGATPRRRRGDVLRVASRTGTSLANARLFARLHTDTADEQRRRIAGELHDSTAQILTHLRLELELLARSVDGEQAELERLARVADRAQQGVRDVINGLRASLHDEGLAGALRSYVADLQSRGGPSLLFHSTSRQHLPPDTEHEVFRIAQEAISNAYQHARADIIEVTVEDVRDGLRLAVADDGVGLADDADDAQGMGLSQMRARAERLGAELHLRSTGRGTQVVLYVPFVRPSLLQPQTGQG